MKNRNDAKVLSVPGDPSTGMLVLKNEIKLVLITVDLYMLNNFNIWLQNISFEFSSTIKGLRLFSFKVLKHLERSYCVSPVNASSSLLFLLLLVLTDLLLTCKRLIPSLKKQKSVCYNLWLSSLIIWIHNGFWPRNIVKALNGVTVSVLNKYEMVTCWHTAGTWTRLVMTS